MNVAGIEVQVFKKNIKNMHLYVTIIMFGNGIEGN